jgi:hypothetical protein
MALAARITVKSINAFDLILELTKTLLSNWLLPIIASLICAVSGKGMEEEEDLHYQSHESKEYLPSARPPMCYIFFKCLDRCCGAA